ncbi:MAG: type II secretion system protein N [Pseudomonadota bacterium]
MLYRKADALSIINVIVLIVLIAFVLVCVRTFIARVYNAKDVKTPALFQTANFKHIKKGLMEYESILINNPFGFTAGALKPLSGSSVKPHFISDIKLIGTISGDDMFSYAVFAGSDGKQEIFKSGEFIPGNGLLKQVEKDKAFIESEDVISEISIVESIAAVNQKTAPSSNNLPSYVNKLDKGEYVIDQKLVESALENPGRFLSNIRLIPNMKNNRQEGFLLRDIKKGEIQDNLGLKNEDIILRVNNFDITNPENALKAFTALKGTNRVRLDIIRSGKRTTMTYQIR